MKEAADGLRWALPGFPISSPSLAHSLLLVPSKLFSPDLALLQYSLAYQCLLSSHSPEDEIQAYFVPWHLKLFINLINQPHPSVPASTPLLPSPLFPHCVHGMDEVEKEDTWLLPFCLNPAKLTAQMPVPTPFLLCLGTHTQLQRPFPSRFNGLSPMLQGHYPHPSP